MVSHENLDRLYAIADYASGRPEGEPNGTSSRNCWHILLNLLDILVFIATSGYETVKKTFKISIGLHLNFQNF